MIDWSTIATTVDTIAKDVEALAPLADMAGPEGVIIGGIVAKGASYVASVAEAANANLPALGAIGSTDLATINAADATTQTANQALAQQVAAS